MTARHPLVQELVLRLFVAPVLQRIGDGQHDLRVGGGLAREARQGDDRVDLGETLGEA